MSPDQKHFGKTIAEHMDDETCWLCGQRVDPSQGIHVATGAHWNCSASLSAIFETKRESGPYLARANGGYFVHTVDPKTNKSLCGHEPKDNAKLMRSRGRWLKVDRVPLGKKRCPHCEKLASADL